MIKKSIARLEVVVAVLGVVLATNGMQNSTNLSTSSKQSNNVVVTNTTNNTANKSDNNMISFLEAQKIASKYIEESETTTGTPQLANQNGKMVYIVPIIYKGKSAGEIYIDAKTGENLGGAGGV